MPQTIILVIPCANFPSQESSHRVLLGSGAVCAMLGHVVCETSQQGRRRPLGARRCFGELTEASAPRSKPFANDPRLMRGSQTTDPWPCEIFCRKKMRKPHDVDQVLSRPCIRTIRSVTSTTINIQDPAGPKDSLNTTPHIRNSNIKI